MLFILLFIDDVTSISHETVLKLYADDMKLYLPVNTELDSAPLAARP